VACGSRQAAYQDFCRAIANDEEAVLLVDSEAPVSAENQQGDPDAWEPWRHLKHRPGDGWDKPTGSNNADCHLMVQCMESWFVADRACLKAFFGQGFKENQLPSLETTTDSIDKSTIYEALANATRSCKTKASYGKGEHSFRILMQIDPSKVTAASPWAKRFIDSLKTKMENAGTG